MNEDHYIRPTKCPSFLKPPFCAPKQDESTTVQRPGAKLGCTAGLLAGVRQAPQQIVNHSMSPEAPAKNTVFVYTKRNGIFQTSLHCHMLAAPRTRIC